MKKLDKIDMKILNALQRDASISMEELAKQVHLSKVPCWKRVKYLKKEGYIKSIVAILDREKLNFNVEVFMQIQTTQHNSAWLHNFSQTLLSETSVVGLYRIMGDIDYIVHTIHRNTAEYDAFYKKLIQIKGINKVSGSIIMESIKQDSSIIMSEQ